MTTGRTFFLKGFATVLLALLLSAKPMRSETVDQQNLTTDRIDITFSNSVGQTFTPTLSSLDFFEVQLRDDIAGNGKGGTFQERIIDNSTGIPQLIGSSSPVILPDGFGDGGQSAVVDFTFPGSVILTPGQQYQMSLVRVSGTTGDRFDFAFQDSDVYSGGNLILDGTKLFSSDLYFREGTGVPAPVPEPASAALVTLGMAAIVIAARRKHLAGIAR